MRWLALLAAMLAALPARAAADGPVDRICALIEEHAGRNNLPNNFFARLIWKESRFDAAAVSPAGAEGIAQFMPGTAKRRGLDDPFDIEKAIPASAAFLAELRDGFGNLGLAAAAYNAGEDRVSRWIARGGYLPMETESYVLDIAGEPVETFLDKGREVKDRALDTTLAFAEACRRLPVIAAATVPMSRIAMKPWGVQVAGNFRQSAAMRQLDRVRARFPEVFSGRDAVMSRVRTPIGRRGIYAVRIGADSRDDADAICAKLRSAGGSCVVMRNR
jgi:hypothetical protein